MFTAGSDQGKQSVPDETRQRHGHAEGFRDTVDDWTQGAPLAKVKALIDHWRHRYDWRRCEAMLNDWCQYKTSIDGLGIHFLHVRSKHKNALPLIITHGWPGSGI